MEWGPVFKTNKTTAAGKTKAAGLPEPARLTGDVTRPGTERVTERLGRSCPIPLSGQDWASWFEGEAVSDDFPEARDPPEAQAREAL